MPADYKLIYFDGRGRAELIRLIFVAANQKFEDSRVDVTKWPEMKPSKYYIRIPYELGKHFATFCWPRKGQFNTYH